MEYQEQNISDVLARFPPNAAIQEMVYKTLDHIENEAAHGGAIMVSVSGGSDSDIMMDLFERVGYPEGLVVYVWFDTGLEYDATKRHLKDLEAKYGLEIKRYRSKMTVAQAVKKAGLPFLSKDVSEKLGQLQRKSFAFSDVYLDVETALKTYSKAKHGITWWFNVSGHKKSNIISTFGLKEFIQHNQPGFMVSKECCRYAKNLQRISA